MLYPEWEPIYEAILEDMGYSRSADEASARLLKASMANADLVGDDALDDIVKGDVTVAGGSGFDVSDIPGGVLIATGSSIPRLLDSGIVPDIIVTDLDGDVEAQKDASSKGALTVMHAHGDNAEAIMEHAHKFVGRVVLTTQSVPDNVIYNFGGFTDGDRAVCIASHFGASRIRLIGFDLDNPSKKDGSDMGTKKRKLEWAGRIVSIVSARTPVEFL